MVANSQLQLASCLVRVFLLFFFLVELYFSLKEPLFFFLFANKGVDIILGSYSEGLLKVTK